MSKKSTVTILTVQHAGRVTEAATEMTLAFASRESALRAISLHLENAERDTTIHIRTLGVISDD